MGKIDWDVVTNYTDVVTTTLKTVTFPKVQEQVYLRNQGNANVTYTIGSQSGTLTPGQSVTVNQDVSSFTLQAVSGTHTFELRAKEKGTEETNTSLNAFVSAPTGIDDTNNIQSTIDSLGVNGGTVILPAGTFYIDKTIIIPSNIKLTGVSNSVTIIKPTESFKNDMINGVLGGHISWNIITHKNFDSSGLPTYNSAWDIEISNIYFVFDDTRASQGGDKNCCIALTNCKRIIVRDCKFINFGQHSVDISGCQDVLVERTYSYNGYWSSIQVDNEGGIYQGIGYLGQASQNIIIRDNYFENNKSDYGAIQIHKNGGNNVTITNNTILNALVGICTDNYYRDNWTIGVNNNVLIDNNTITSNVVNAIGISIGKQVNQLQITNNRVSVPSGDPVYIRSGNKGYMTDFVMSGNYFQGVKATIIGVTYAEIFANTFQLTGGKISIASTYLNFFDNNILGYGVLLQDVTVTDPRDSTTYSFANDNSIYRGNRFLSASGGSDSVSFFVYASAFKLLSFLNNAYFATGTAFDFTNVTVNTGISIEDYFRSLKRTVSTSGRLTNGLIKGTLSYDNNLNKPIWWNGSNWTDASGTVV